MKKLLLVVMLILCVGVSFLQFYDPKIYYGNKIVSQIEEFRQVNGRTPKSYAEMGIDSNKVGPYYKQVSKKRYVLWYNIGFDDELNYDSDRKTWSPDFADRLPKEWILNK